MFTDEVLSPSEDPKKKNGSNTPVKLARAKPDKYSEEADMSKDMLGQANDVLSYFQLGYEGVSSGEAKLTQIFTKIETKAKKTPRKLVYADSEREASDEFMTRNFSDRLFLESSGTFDTHGKAHSASKSKKSLPKGKDPSRPRRSRRLKNQSKVKERARREKSKTRGRRPEYQETSSDTGYEEGSKYMDEDLNSPYKIHKPTPFTLRITCFKYHMRAKLPRNVRMYEGNKDPKDHLSIFSVAAEQEEWSIPICLTDEPIVLEGIIEGHQVQRIHVDSGRSSKIMYEHCFKSFGADFQSRLRKCRTSLVGFSSETYHPSGVIDLRVTMGKAGRSKMVLMEFVIVKCQSPYNVLIGRTKMRSLGAVGSTIHSMIKFSTDQGVVSMETSKEALWECRQLEKTQNSWKETQWRQRMEQTSRIQEQVILRARDDPGRRPEHGRACMVSFWEDGSTVVYHGTSAKGVSIGRTGSPHETTTNARQKTSIKGKDDKEKTGFHTEEGVYGFTHMTKGQNVEVYMEEIVVKSKDEQSLMKDMEKTLNKLKRVNMKTNPNESTFEMKKGRILGYTITEDKIRPDPTQVQAVMKSHRPRSNTTPIPTTRKHRQMVNKFLKQKELWSHMLIKQEEEELRQNKKLQIGVTPMPRAWRLYLSREVGRVGSGVGMIILGPDEEMYSYDIRLNFDAPDHNMDYEALLAGLVASAGKVGIPQSRSIGGNQNKAINQGEKQWQRGKSNKQGVSLEKSKKNVNGLHPTSQSQFSLCNRLNGANGLG
nr:reverse transcriptase domain-containing protein [Tanacetum cinerariifolium]